MSCHLERDLSEVANELKIYTLNLSPNLGKGENNDFFRDGRSPVKIPGQLPLTVGEWNGDATAVMALVNNLNIPHFGI